MKNVAKVEANGHEVWTAGPQSEAAIAALESAFGLRLPPSYRTFVASANAVMYVGARPVFLDSERRSWNLDPELLEKELAARARAGREQPAALVGVDLYGQCADWDPIVTSCANYGVPVIEDAAEALGARYKGRPVGRFGSAGCLSFNGNKLLTCGGGGARCLLRAT